MEDISINEEFILVTKELKDFMQSLEKKCIDFDSSLKEFSLQKQIAFIDSHKESFERISELFNKLWIITKNISKQENKVHQKYVQRELLSYFLRDTSPLNKQIYTKPLGYAGDYVIANYLYEDGYPGSDTYGKLVGKYTLSLALSRAHRFRRFYLKNIILKTINEYKSQKEIKIASFACGPAIEILDVLEQCDVPENVTFYCIDGEKKAISQIENNLRIIERNRKKTFKVNLLNHNILKILQRKIILDGVKNINLIYAAGFIDYLSDKTSSMLIEYLYNLLIRDGILIVVNVYKEHTHRFYLEMLGEWYLNHRDENCMLELTKRLPGPKEITIDFDSTKTNIYLIIKKK